MNFMIAREYKTTSFKVLKKLSESQDIVFMDKGQPFALMVKITPETFEQDLSLLRRARSVRLIERIQERSRQTGGDKITLKEIDAEIRKVRKAQAGRGKRFLRAGR